jgi:hypothetical protein
MKFLVSSIAGLLCARSLNFRVHLLKLQWIYSKLYSMYLLSDLDLLPFNLIYTLLRFVLRYSKLATFHLYMLPFAKLNNVGIALFYLLNTN